MVAHHNSCCIIVARKLMAMLRQIEPDPIRSNQYLTCDEEHTLLLLLLPLSPLPRTCL